MFVFFFIFTAGGQINLLSVVYQCHKSYFHFSKTPRFLCPGDPQRLHTPEWMPSALTNSLAMAVVTVETSDPRRYLTPR